MASEFEEVGGWKSFLNGEWLKNLLPRAFKSYWKNSSAEFFREKYPGLSDDQIASKIIKLSCKNAAAIGIGAGLLMSTNEITAFLTGGEGLVGLPANIALACATIGGELITLTRVHLKLIADLGNLYSVPLDVNDPEEVWELIFFAFGSSSVEATGGILVKLSRHWTKLGLKAYFKKARLAFWKKQSVKYLGKEMVGKGITQRGIVKYAVPVASMAVGGTWNYIATLVVGNYSKKYFKERMLKVLPKPLSQDNETPSPTTSGGPIIDHVPRLRSNEI